MSASRVRPRGLVAGSFLAAALLSLPLAFGHGPARRAPPPTPEETAAFETARPAFERHCFRCHSRDARKPKRKALKHVDMATYPFAGHHGHDAGRAVRVSLVGDPGRRKKPTMPPDDPGAIGEDLQAILAWAEAWEKAHAPPARPVRGHAH